MFADSKSTVSPSCTQILKSSSISVTGENKGYPYRVNNTELDSSPSSSYSKEKQSFSSLHPNNSVFAVVGPHSTAINSSNLATNDSLCLCPGSTSTPTSSNIKKTESAALQKSSLASTPKLIKVVGTPASDFTYRRQIVFNQLSISSPPKSLPPTNRGATSKNCNNSSRKRFLQFEGVAAHFHRYRSRSHREGDIISIATTSFTTANTCDPKTGVCSTPSLEAATDTNKTPSSVLLPRKNSAPPSSSACAAAESLRKSLKRKMSTKGKKTPRLLKGSRGHRKPIIPKWKLFRANEPFLSVFMWGVNHCTSELSHVPPPKLLMPDDFKSFSKVKVDNHGFNKENMPSHFKVKEYCPHVFRNLRERFGVDENEYMTSLSGSEPIRVPGDRRFITSYDLRFLVKLLSPENVAEMHQILAHYHKHSLVNKEPTGRDNPGRSSAKFYVSYDLRFIIKTLLAEEVAEVHQILKDYHEYVVEKHGKTLLPQYLGMYRLTVEGSETYLIVMRNIFGRKYPVHKKFDLKGSTVQRQASEKERSKELPTFKDNDFLDEGSKLYLPKDAKDKLMIMLKADTDFLTKLHLMDYSLLVGIHDVDKAAEDEAEALANQAAAGPRSGGEDSEDDYGDDGEYGPPSPPDSPVPSSTGAFGPLSSESGLELDDEFYAIPSTHDEGKKEIYFIGLVDILTYYGVKKKTAFAAKSVKYGAEAEISTVKPEQYAKRLQDFVGRAISDVAGSSLGSGGGVGGGGNDENGGRGDGPPQQSSPTQAQPPPLTTPPAGQQHPHSSQPSFQPSSTPT